MMNDDFDGVLFKTKTVFRIDNSAEVTVVKSGYGLKMILEDLGCNKIEVYVNKIQLAALAQFLQGSINMPQDYSVEGDD